MIPAAHGRVPTPGRQELLVAEGVVKHFENGQVTALRGVDFAAHAGDVTAITGPSGCGKSTLLNVLGLLDTPSTGHVRVNGTSTSGLPEVALRRLRARQIGFVFQDALLDPTRTAAENVMQGLRYAGVARRARRDVATAGLTAVGLGHRVNHPARLLSGGERQRVAIARAIAHKPSILLCDEPTGALDEDATRAIAQLIFAQAEHNRTVVIVTHDLDLARQCTRWAELRQGHLAWRVAA